MFVTQGQRAQGVAQPQLSNQRQTRDQQKKEFHKILVESNEVQDDQLLQKLSTDLEEQAFVQSKGENTREYRSRVNTVKIKMKGDRGKFLRQCLFDGTINAEELMAMDMNKLSEEFFKQYLLEHNKSVKQVSAAPPQQLQPMQTIPKAPLRPVQARPNQQVSRPTIPPPQAPAVKQPPVQKVDTEEPQQIQPLSASTPADDQNTTPAVMIGGEQGDESEFDPPREAFLDDLSGPNQFDQDQNFLQMQKNLEGMKRLAEQLDQDDDDDDQDQEEAQEEIQNQQIELQQDNENDYKNLEPLPSSNILNQEFIKDDEIDNTQPQENLLDFEITDQEQNYYEPQQNEQDQEQEQQEQPENNYEQDDQENQDYQQELEQYNEEVNYEQQDSQHFGDLQIIEPSEQPNQDQHQNYVQPHEDHHSHQQNNQQPIVKVNPPQQTTVEQIPLFTPPTFQPIQQQVQKEQKIQDKEYNLPLQQTQQSQKTSQQNNQPQTQSQSDKPSYQQLITPCNTQVILQDNLEWEQQHDNIIVQNVLEKLVQQREQFYEQQLEEQRQQNQLLQDEIKQIVKVYNLQVQTLQQKNTHLAQENQILRVQNEALQGELENIKTGYLKQINQLQQAFQSERQRWTEERESLLDIQPSSNFDEQINFLQNEQNQFNSILNDIQRRNREKNEQLLSQLRSKGTDVDKFNENLNQFRLLLIKLHPHTVSRQQPDQQSYAESRASQQTITQPSQLQNQNQNQFWSQPASKQIMQVNHPSETTFVQEQRAQPQQEQRSQEIRVFSSPVDEFPNQHNLYGDSGSTQTQSQMHTDDQTKNIRRQEEQYHQTEEVEQQHNYQTQQPLSNSQQYQPPPKTQTQVQQPQMATVPIPQPVGPPKASIQPAQQSQKQEQVFGHPKLIHRKQPASQNQAQQPKPQAQNLRQLENNPFAESNNLEDNRSLGSDFFQQFEANRSMESSQSHPVLPKKTNQPNVSQQVNRIGTGNPSKKQTKPQHQQVPGALFD